jgi:predicted RNA-binding Zn ribbon-like protein
MVLDPPNGPAWIFDPGALFTEFMLTGGPGELVRYDVLNTPDDLRRWAQASRLELDPSRLDVTPDDVPVGRALRDALWRSSWDAIAGGPVSAADLAVLNDAASRPDLAPQVGVDQQLTWAAPATGAAVLSSVARDAIHLLTGPAVERLRECEGDNCRLVFLDTSRPGTRRWCSMQRCGNRHKVRALRSRRAGLPAADQESAVG